MRLRGSSWLFLLLCGGAAQADGWLASEAGVRHASLLEGDRIGTVLAQAPRRLELLTRDQLLYERQLLEEDIPGLGGPIAILCVGGGGLLIGGVYLWLGLSVRSGLSAVGSLVTLGVIGLVVGVAGGIAGILWILSRIAERASIQDQIREIDQQLSRVHDRGPPPEDFSPPPPPPIPPGVLGPTPVPMTLLARF